MIVQFFVPGIPKTAGSKRAFPHSKTGKTVVMDDQKKGKGWRQDIQVFATKAMAGRNLFSVPLDVTFLFHLPRPKWHFGKKGLKPSAPEYPTSRPDLLKMARAAEDALTSICYTDDSIIVEEHLYKVFAEDGRAGCTVIITEMHSSGETDADSGNGHQRP